MSVPRAIQLLGLLLIVVAGLLYTYHVLAAWHWLTIGLIALGGLIALIATVLLLLRPSRPAQSPAHEL